MIARVAVWLSTIAAIVLVVSFGLFALDQAREGSKQQVAKADETSVNAAAPNPRTERDREKQHGDVREAIDDANDVLVSPFAGVVDSDSIWVQRGIPTLIALLLFGVGLRVLAGYLPGGGRR